MADSSSFAVEEGDVIMLGTDGLFDNMSEDMLLHHVSKLQVCKQVNIFLLYSTGGGYTVLPLSFRPSQDIFLSNY